MIDDHSSGSTSQFKSPAELGRCLFNRTVDPGDTGQTRLRLAILSDLYARRKWRETHIETDFSGGSDNE